MILSKEFKNKHNPIKSAIICNTSEESGGASDFTIELQYFHLSGGVNLAVNFDGDSSDIFLEADAVDDLIEVLTNMRKEL